jgi:hypothetical protein
VVTPDAQDHLVPKRFSFQPPLAGPGLEARPQYPSAVGGSDGLGDELCQGFLRESGSTRITAAAHAAGAVDLSDGASHAEVTLSRWVSEKPGSPQVNQTRSRRRWRRRSEPKMSSTWLDPNPAQHRPEFSGSSPARNLSIARQTAARAHASGHIWGECAQYQR